MASASLNSLSVAKKLKSTGMPENQAEAIAELFTLRQAEPVTNQSLELALRALELRIITRIGGLIAAGVALLALLIEF